MCIRDRYFIITIFILILNKYYSNYEKIHNEVRKVNKKNILLIVIIGMIGFHYTQVIFNKSIYNNEYMNTVGKYTEIQTIFLDTAIYTNGNISNSDKYIDYSKENTEKPIFCLLYTSNGQHNQEKVHHGINMKN